MLEIDDPKLRLDTKLFAVSGAYVTPQGGYLSRFLSAFVRRSVLDHLLDPNWRRQQNIRRFELGMAVKTPYAAPAGAAGVPPVNGVVSAFIDFGCPFAHANFLDGNRPRVRYLWDQEREPDEATWWHATSPTDNSITMSSASSVPSQPSATGTRQPLFGYGAELRANDRASKDLDHLFLKFATAAGAPDEDACYEAVDYTLMRRSATHGAHVMDIAAGWPDPLQNRLDDGDASSDAAGRSNIVFVQLPSRAVADTSGGSMNVYVLDALRYIAHRTPGADRVVVNLSYGTFAGPHDGSSLLEGAIDALIEEQGRDRFFVVLPAGNSFNAGCHATIELRRGESCDLPWSVMADDPTDNFLELWYAAEGSVSVTVIPPAFDRPAVADVVPGQIASFPAPQSELDPPPNLVVAHVASANAPDGSAAKNCALVAIGPTRVLDDERAESPHGEWTVRLQRPSTDSGPERLRIEAWIERDDPVLDIGWADRQSRFVIDPQDDDRIDYPAPAGHFRPTKFGTLNTFATGTSTRVAGAARAEADTPDELPSPYTAANFEHRDVDRICCVAPADRRPALSGRLAAGNRSGHSVRLNGTSVAAPQLARVLLNGDAPEFVDEPAPADALDRARWGRGRLARVPTED